MDLAVMMTSRGKKPISIFSQYHRFTVVLTFPRFAVEVD